MSKKTTLKSNTPPIHFGKIFENYLVQHRTHKAVLARLLGKTFRMINYYSTSESVKSSTIESISHILQHNFFMDMAAQLPGHYTVSAQQDTSGMDEIAALKKEILLLKTEKNVLMQIIKDKSQ